MMSHGAKDWSQVSLTVNSPL